ncbi:MAG: CDP-glycerol glycerophosphotransferase family protein [bacterium]|nr:CDP-glycerol glycerophosphotransferase family protein [bacterium]
MRTIFITSFHPLISRNILMAGVARELAKEFRVIVVVPAYKVPYFEKEHGGKGITIRGVGTDLSPYDFFFRSLILLFTNSRGMRIKEAARCAVQYGFFRCTVGPVIRRVFGNQAPVLALVRFLDRLFYSTGRFDVLFREFKPGCIFATDIQNEMDVRLLHEARRRGIRTIGMVRSWDNITSKGNLRVVPDHIVVHNERIKNELVSYSKVPAGHITPVGIPHYDRYLGTPKKSREEFMKEHRFDSRRKTVMFAPIGDRYIRNNTLDAMVFKELAQLPLNLIVRMPPTDMATLGKPKNPSAIIAFDETGQESERLRTEERSRKQNEISTIDEEHLHEELTYSDVLVTGHSTLVNDAALVDLPAVIIAFDQEPRKYLDSIRRYYDYEYYVPIVESGGISLASSVGELIQEVREALEDRNRLQEGRKRIVKEQAMSGDGRSTERLVSVIRSSL